MRNRAVGVLVAAAATTLTVLAAVAHHRLLVVDRPLSEALRRDDLLVVMRWITEAGSPTSAAVLSLVAAAALWPLCRAFAMALPTTVAAGIAVDLSLKVLIDRPRPADVVIGTALGSFPNGHVIQATVVLGLLVPALYLVTGRIVVFWSSVVLSVVMVAGVASSRIALGAHWPSDVLASILIAASLLMRRARSVAGRARRRTSTPPVSCGVSDRSSPKYWRSISAPVPPGICAAALLRRSRLRAARPRNRPITARGASSGSGSAASWSNSSRNPSPGWWCGRRRRGELPGTARRRGGVPYH
ncbi:MAG: phosphatase PAP2 family protein [Actinobacteria bacterium]|nr:phosphatase PAP2 family protein [Actinomycetota bacterium]